MFGKLPELFERNFAIGYFLPVVAFVIATLMLLGGAGIQFAGTSVSLTSQIDTLLGGVMIGLFSWLIGVCLLVVNRDLVRFMEGYGRFNPAQMFLGLERSRYQKLDRDLKVLNKEYRESLDNKDKTFSLERNKERNRLLREKVETFPDEQFILPTRFGNIIRAFEVYPTKMYGVDAIYGWNRLQAVMPNEYRDLVNDAKAQVDFWVNMFFLSLLFLVEYIVVMIYVGQFFIFWLPLITLVVISVAYIGAQRSAVEWGDLIKAAFDIFLPDLRKKLQFKQTADTAEERALWTAFSRAIIYVVPDDMPERTFADKENNQEDGGKTLCTQAQQERASDASR